ncbi:MAG: AP protein [Planctomycetota bacterium]|nr:MAG: AP protein [Planctomycetota bacterium]
MSPRLYLLVSLLLLAAPLARGGEPATENVILFMTDGLRWQEVFTGAEKELISAGPGGVKNVAALEKTFWRETPEERREVLMPFLWSEVARHGQIYGNRKLDSKAQVTNGLNFSYPGYNEILCGFVDPRIDSNDKNLNPNITVFEWLARRPQYRGRVAAFACWDCFPYIFNYQRCGFPVNAGNDPLAAPDNPRIELLNRLRAESTKYFPGESWDAILFHTALEYFQEAKPRVFFVSLGETDTWGHAGRYDHYLEAAHRADDYIRQLWETAQSMPEYRGKTSMIVAVDHGRGDAPVEWKSHGENIDRSEFVWMAFLGPDTPALGERKNAAPVTQNQIAATLAALVGEDYPASVPQAGAPIVDVLPAP